MFPDSGQIQVSVRTTTSALLPVIKPLSSSQLESTLRVFVYISEIRLTLALFSGSLVVHRTEGRGVLAYSYLCRAEQPNTVGCINIRIN